MLSNEQIEKNYAQYIDLITTYVKRDGVDALLKWLVGTDVKVAPASTIYHLCCEGGLIQHSLNVYNRLKKLISVEYPTMVADANGEMKQVENACPYSEESLVLVALLHDIAKINYYEIQYRNTKDANGDWVKVPYYSVRKNHFIYGSHPMNCAYMVRNFVKLSREEELAILYHEACFGYNDDKFDTKTVMPVYKKYPLALLLHQADLQATCLDEEEG